jgi:hypothetical protein
MIQNKIDRLQGGNFIDACDTATEVLDCPIESGNDKKMRNPHHPCPGHILPEHGRGRTSAPGPGR